MPVPLPPKDGLAALANKVKEDSDEESTPAPSTSTESEYGSEESSKPIFFQECLNGLIKYLALSKQKQNWVEITRKNLLQKNVLLPITESTTRTCRQFL